jgi:hypothetical protein
VSHTVTDFKTRFTEFASESDTRVQLYLDDAELFVSESAWEARYDLGVLYLAAHLLENDNAQGGASAGPVNKRKVGEVEESYAVQATDSDSELMSTQYGRRFAYYCSLVFASRVF